MKKKRMITVFGSGHMEENFPEYQRAVLLGRVLAENGFSICTGGYGGIMEAAPRGAKQVGGKTFAVVAKELGVVANRWIDQVRIEKNWRDRLFRLISMGDAFVVFDGGTGTFTELFVVWEMLNKKLLHKPIIIHGPEMIRWVRRLKRQRLILFNRHLSFAASPAEVVDSLEELLENPGTKDS